jgi:tRNA(Ile)-lysidine synthase
VDEAGRGGTSQAIAALASALPADAHVLIAVSGGPDSVALLLAGAAWARAKPLARVFSATVDHGLRPGSADEADFCARIAAKLQIPHSTLVWEGQKPATGLQAAARDARYRLLIGEARQRGVRFVVTAHHADDQAETVMMRIASGSGVAGLRGMRRSSSLGGLTLVRPFLGLRKDILETVCREADLTPADDPSNSDTRFGRARMRGLMPALAREGLTIDRLNRLARRAASADDALDMISRERLEIATEARTDCVLRLSGAKLAVEPQEIRLRMLGMALAMAGPGPVKLEALETLGAELHAAIETRSRLRRTLGGRMATLKQDGTLIIGPAPPRRTG